MLVNEFWCEYLSYLYFIISYKYIKFEIEYFFFLLFFLFLPLLIFI